MSPLVTWPCLPEPSTSARIDAGLGSHLAHRRRQRHVAGADFGGRGRRRGLGGRSRRRPWAAGGGGCFGWLRGAPAPSLIWPSSAPTATVSPSLAAMSPSTPAAGAGTSIVTLSVSSSTSGSSTATASPAFLNHLPMVASVTDLPSVGTRISAMIVLCLCSHLAHSAHVRRIRPLRRMTTYPSASSRNCLSCARCFDISPVAVDAEAGRPA